jgi:hypothetical protein
VGFDAVQSGSLPAFWRSILPPSYGPKRKPKKQAARGKQNRGLRLPFAGFYLSLALCLLLGSCWQLGLHFCPEDGGSMFPCTSVIIYETIRHYIPEDSSTFHRLGKRSFRRPRQRRYDNIEVDHRNVEL